MKIGIDFDDTIVETKEKVSEYLKKYNLEGFNNFKEKEIFYRQHIDEMMVDLKLKSNVVEILNKLSVDNELYLITARNDFYSKNVKGLVLEYIKENKLPFKEIYFDCYKEQKGLKCKELNIDLFIDDLPENCLAVKEYGIDTLLFGNYHEDLITVNSWNEVVKYMEEKYGRKDNN